MFGFESITKKIHFIRVAVKTSDKTYEKGKTTKSLEDIVFLTISPAAGCPSLKLNPSQIFKQGNNEMLSLRGFKPNKDKLNRHLSSLFKHLNG